MRKKGMVRRNQRMRRQEEDHPKPKGWCSGPKDAMAPGIQFNRNIWILLFWTKLMLKFFPRTETKTHTRNKRSTADDAYM